MKPFISIVVPVYNGEKYLDRLIQSILIQQFVCWELILVENASKDKSYEMCLEYKRRDKRIKVIKIDKNCGANGARKAGVNNAGGDYITFIDADDYVDKDYLFDVSNALNHTKTQLLVLGVKEEYYDSDGKIDFIKEIKAVDDKKILYLKNKNEVRREIVNLEEKTLYGYLWNKFYNREYLLNSKIDFVNMPLLEDAKFNVMYAMNIETMTVINKGYYHYCKRLEISLTKRFIKDYFLIHQEHVKLLYNQFLGWNILDTTNKGILGNIYARYIISALEQNCDKRSNFNHKNRVNFVKQIFDDKLYENILLYSNGKNKINTLIFKILKSKSIFLYLAMGRSIYIVKHKMPGVFKVLRRK